MSDLGSQIVELAWLWSSMLGVLLGLSTFERTLKGDDWAPMLVMATVPIQRELLVGYGGTHLSYTQVAVIGFFAGALISFATGKLRIRIDAVTVAAGSVVALYGLSVLSTSSVGDWAGETYRWLVSGLFLVVARSFFTNHSARRVPYLLVAGAGTAGLWALWQVNFGSGPPSFVRSGFMRAHGAFGEPNPYAAFAWACLLLLLGCGLVSNESRLLRSLAWTGAAISIMTVALTQSRGGFLGAAAGIAVIVGYRLLRTPARRQRFASACLAVIGAVLVSVGSISAPWRHVGDQTTSANWADQERSAHWSAAVEMVQDDPVLGVGAGGFSREYRAHTTSWRFRISRGHAHNAYLQVAAEAGIPAMLAYIWLLASIAASLIRRASLGRTVWLSIGALGITAALAFHQLVDYLHVMSLGIVFAGMWAAALAVGKKGLSQREHNLAA